MAAPLGNPPIRAVNYIEINDKEDRKLAHQFGIIVHLMARLKTPTNDAIILQGNKGTLNNWQTRLACNAELSTPGTKTFIFQVPPEQANGPLSFALTRIAGDGKRYAQEGRNFSHVLTGDRFIVDIKVNNLGFKD